LDLNKISWKSKYPKFHREFPEIVILFISPSFEFIRKQASLWIQGDIYKSREKDKADKSKPNSLLSCIVNTDKIFSVVRELSLFSRRERATRIGGRATLFFIQVLGGSGFF
jgi:hypothetical protein